MPPKATSQIASDSVQDAVALAGTAFDQGNAIRALEILEAATGQGDYAARMALIGFFEIKERLSSGWMMNPPDALHRHVAQLQDASNAGNAFSTTLLGMVYQSGVGDIGKDARRAAMLYEDAAKRGNSLAMVMLGRLYDFNGQPEIARDENKAIQLYGQAIAANDAHGMYNMSTLYPSDTQKSEVKQLRYRAAELRFPAALQRLAECASEECASFARKEAEMAIPHGLAYQTFFGANPVSTYLDAKAICVAEEKYALAHEWNFFWQINYSEMNSLFYLEHCVTKFGYLPSPSIRNWMLQMKKANRDSKNVSLLSKYFTLEDFDETDYSFTHRDRIEHIDDIAKALDKSTINGFSLGSGASESEYYPNNCFNELRTLANVPTGFITTQAELRTYMSAESSYVNCLYRFMQSFSNFDHAAQIKKVLPGYYYMTAKEQKGVEERIYAAARYFPQKTLQDIKEVEARTKNRIEESIGIMRDIERSKAQNRAEWSALIGDLVQKINTYASQLRPPPPPDLAEFNRIVEMQAPRNPNADGHIKASTGVSSARGGKTAGDVTRTEKKEEATNAPSSRIYQCTTRVHFDHGLQEWSATSRLSEPAFLTVEQACAKAQKKASDFAMAVDRGEIRGYPRGKVRSIGTCALMAKDDSRVGLYINIEEPSSSPCNASASSVAK